MSAQFTIIGIMFLLSAGIVIRLYIDNPIDPSDF